MKRRILSILTALALCLSLLPGTAFAAEYPPEPSAPPVPSMSSKPSVPSEPPASPEPDVPSGTMRAASLEARDMGSEITILPGNDSSFVFANGIPIVIEEAGGATRIYDEEGTLLSGDWDVTCWCIYGGWFDYDVHYSDTSITMRSGTVRDLFGGNYAAGLTGNTRIEILGGSVTFLCGAGNYSVTNGNTSVLIEGGEVNTLYGGGYEGVINGNTSVAIEKGIVTFLCGGSLSGDLNGNTSVTLNGGSVGWAFGGGTVSMVTGTATVTVNQGASVLGDQLFDSSAPVKGNVYGGGRDGTVKKTHVIYNGGDVGFLYGGGEYTVGEDGSLGPGCCCPNVCIEIRGPLDENSDGMMVYGGGFGGEVDSAEIKFYGTAYNSGNRTMDICGSGYGDTMGHVKFTIGSESDPGSLIFYAHNPLDETSVVKSAEFNVDITNRGPKINALDGCDVDGKVSAYFHGDGDTNTDKTADIGLVEVDEVTVEDGCFIFPGDPPLPDHPNNVGKLNLDRLEIIDSRVIFYNLNEANITDMVCDGATVCFETNGGMPAPVQVTNITAQNPIKLDRNGVPTAAIWENLVMFEGPGVGALVDSKQFVSAVEGYVPVKTEDGSGVKMGIADQRKQALLVPPHFDHASYQYGDTITITVGLMEEPDNTPIVGEEVEILAGNDSRRQVLARATTGENGMADAVVPVNEALWGGEYTFLAVEYLGNDVYIGNSYAASLKEEDGTSGSIYLEITQADIVLTSEIVEPEFTAVPSTGFATSPDAFYTAEVVWTPADAAFRPEVEYTASIRLIPKQGYSVAPDRIDSITYQGKVLDKPNAVEVDGCLLLSDVARFTIPSIPVTGVTLEPDTLTLAVGDMFRLVSEVLPSDAQSWDGDWNSSDPDVASVSSQGTVTAVGAGTATITVTVHAASGTYSADCIVTVHGWQTEWSSDENYHWHACTDESCTEVKDRAGHSWDEGVVTTPPTEAAAGEKKYTCTVCGRTRAETVPSLGHTHHWQTEWSSDENYHWHACTDESCTEVKDRAGHSWNEGVVTTPPTEAAAGEKTYTCTVCGRTRAETVPPLGHTHHWQAEWSSDENYHWHACTDESCTEVKDRAAHSWDEGVVTTPPTEAAAGEKTYTCTVCGRTRAETVPSLGHTHHWQAEWSSDENYHWHACTDESCTEVKDRAGHSWDEGVVTTPPTEAAAGEKTYTCTVCGRTRAETVPSLDHTHHWQTEWSSDENYHWHACTGESCTEVKDRAGHSWNEGVVTTPPTEAAAGEKTYTCTVCGRTRAETVPSLGHTSSPSPSSDDNSGSGNKVSTYVVTIEKSEHGNVTSSKTNAAGNSTVTLTVTPDDGYVLDTLTVTDSRGNAIKLTARGGGKYTFTMPSRAVIVKAAFVPRLEDMEQPCDGGMDCPAHSFTDLGTVGTWYHEAVDYVLRNGLMNGGSNGIFGPNDNLTRAQFAQILYNKEGKPAVTGSSMFADVTDGLWYAPAVTWAAENGIVSGYGSGLFGPDDSITREQLAVMLWRYAGSPVAIDKELHFTDADKANGYALDALRWAVEDGILYGYGDGRLNPNGLATRAQAAQMLQNYLEKYIKAEQKRKS